VGRAVDQEDGEEPVAHELQDLTTLLHYGSANSIEPAVQV
jgi:hypothetical protein